MSCLFDSIRSLIASAIMSICFIMAFSLAVMGMPIIDFMFDIMPFQAFVALSWAACAAPIVLSHAPVSLCATA
jgi:hypothetical protein